MTVGMASDVRLVIKTDDELRDALRLAAARLRVEMSELADSILREALADEISEIRNPPTRPTGRKPKKSASEDP